MNKVKRIINQFFIKQADVTCGRNKNKVIISIILCIFSLLLFGAADYYNYNFLKQKMEKNNYINALNCYNNMFDNGNLKQELKLDDVYKCEVKIDSITYQTKREKLKGEITNVKSYIQLKNDIESSYVNDSLKSDISYKYLESLKERNQHLDIKYRKLLSDSINDMEYQLNFMSQVVSSVDQLFINGEVKLEVDRETYNNVLNQVNELKQDDVKNKQLQYLQKVESTVTQREVEYQRKKAEEQKKRELEIANAWVHLSIPYVSQNHSGVYNGCEAASLLMCLKYKGYLSNMDLVTYAKNMPKSSDPYQGFVHDIFGLEPSNIVHWIAPSPLARYGVSSSGNSNVFDTTGYSIDQLDRELDSNNPSVIYLTGNLNNPKKWQGDVPGNLHVLVLSGYNKITGQHIIVDPWTKSDGNHILYVSKAKLESIYNSVGKRSVVVK